MRAAGESSVDDLGDAEKGRLGVGRLRKDFGSDIARDHDVVAESCVGGLVVSQNLGHGLDVRGVQFVELADVFEDFVNLRAIGFELGLGEIEVGKFGDAENVFAGDFHGFCEIFSDSETKILAQPKWSYGSELEYESFKWTLFTKRWRLESLSPFYRDNRLV